MQPAGHAALSLSRRAGSRRKELVILCLLAVIAFMAYRITMIENQRYALAVGMCRDAAPLRLIECLETTQTRTSPLWHLYYALLTR